jgi:hypothetical protein
MVTAVATSVSTSSFVIGPKLIRAPGQPGAALDGAGAPADDAGAGAAVDRASGAAPSHAVSRSNAAAVSDDRIAGEVVGTT